MAGHSVHLAARLDARLAAQLPATPAAQELYRLTEADVREVAGGFRGFEDSALAITHEMCGPTLPNNPRYLSPRSPLRRIAYGWQGGFESPPCRSGTPQDQ